MKSFFKSFRFAFQGLFFAFKNERNLKLHLVAFVLVCFLSFFLSISLNEWIIILLVSALVISLELINSAIERLCDLYTTDADERVKRIKDISAGAVLVSAILAAVIGLMIFLPRVLRLIG